MKTGMTWFAQCIRTALTAALLCPAGVAWAQGPKRQPPPVETPNSYKTGNSARPSTSTGTSRLGRADWWTLFGDSTLDDLETRAVRSNQNILQAVARIEEERLRARASGADFLPHVESNLTAAFATPTLEPLPPRKPPRLTRAASC